MRQPAVESTQPKGSSHMPDDEAKRKFKEALDRKNKQNHTGESHLGGKSKARGPHGSASHQQQFRRKSG